MNEVGRWLNFMTSWVLGEGEETVRTVHSSLSLLCITGLFDGIWAASSFEFGPKSDAIARNDESLEVLYGTIVGMN